MGFLDMFDNPNVLEYLLGGAPMGITPPRPPQQAPNPSVQTAGIPGLEGGPSGPPMMSPPNPPVQTAGVPGGAGSPSGPAVMPPPNNLDAVIAGTNAGVPSYGSPVSPSGGGGLITPANAAPSPALPGQPPVAPSGVTPGPGVPGPPGSPSGPVQVAMAPQQGPIEAQPPPMPPPAPPGAPAPATQGGNLMRAFGLSPGQIRAANPMPTVSPWQNAMAALGSGLSTVGGNTGGGAFARGMGGAISGGLKQNQLQSQDVRQAHNDLFNQSNVAYRDMLAGLARNDASMVANARARMFDATSQMRQMGGKDAFSGSPYAKSLKLENDLDRQDANAAKIAKQQFDVSSKGTDVDGAIKAYNDTIANIAATRDQRRTDQAKRRGIDPNGYLAGSDQQHAFDYDKLTPEQQLRMPEDSIYKWKDKNGQTQYGTRNYDRTPPYDGWQRPGPPQQQPSPAVMNNALYGGNGEGDYGTEAA